MPNLVRLIMNATTGTARPKIPAFYTHVILPFFIIWVLWITLEKARKWRAGKATPLNGPENTSFLFGLYRLLNESEDPGLLYEEWANEYGPAFTVPGGFGSSRIVICDPRANAHFYSKETFGYVQTKLARVFIENLVNYDSLYLLSDTDNSAVWPRFTLGGGRESSATTKGSVACLQ